MRFSEGAPAKAINFILLLSKFTTFIKQFINHATNSLPLITINLLPSHPDRSMRRTTANNTVLL
jgi:hypothetical protein